MNLGKKLLVVGTLTAVLLLSAATAVFACGRGSGHGGRGWCQWNQTACWCQNGQQTNVCCHGSLWEDCSLCQQKPGCHQRIWQ